MSKRRVGKSLEFDEATSVLSAKAIRGAEDVELFRLVPMLLEWGMRHSLVTELTELPKQTVKRIAKRDAMPAKTGSPPTSIAPILADARLQLMGSLFLVMLRSRVDPVTRAIDARAVCYAYWDYLRATAPEPPVLDLDTAYNVIAKWWRDRQVRLRKCKVCDTAHLQSVDAVSVDGILVHGDCPLCRLITATDRFTPLIVGQSRQDKARKAIASQVGS